MNKNRKYKIGEIALENDGTWDVKLTKNGVGFSCERQIEAEILSRLVKIQERLGMKTE